MRLKQMSFHNGCVGFIFLISIFAISCENSVTYPASQTQKIKLKPVVQPRPSQITKQNDITIYRDITLGAQDNPDFGGLINLDNGYVYDLENADDVQSQIDFTILDGSTSHKNFITPASSRFNAWSGDRVLHIYNLWYILNEGTLIRLSSPDSTEIKQYEDIQSEQDIDSAFDYFLNNVQYRTGYSATNDGPKNNIRLVEEGDIILFKSKDRNTIAAMRVTLEVPGTTGLVQLEIKAGNY